MTDLAGEASADPVSGVSKDDKTMAMLAHLLGIVTGFIGPLVIYLVKKDESEYVKEHAKEALNFQITVMIASIVSGILMLVLIGFLLLAAVGIGALVLAIIAGLKANDGHSYRYPLTIRFL